MSDQVGSQKRIRVWHGVRARRYFVPQCLTLQADGSWKMSQEDRHAFETEIRKAVRVQRKLLAPAKIRVARQSTGLSQRRLSEITGGGVQAVYRYEHDRVRPSRAANTNLKLIENDPDLAMVFAETSGLDMLPEEITAIRVSLGLTKRGASRVFGGGSRSFQKYERGDVPPCEAMRLLLRVVAHRPELLDALGGQGHARAKPAISQWPPVNLEQRLLERLAAVRRVGDDLTERQHARRNNNQRLILKYRAVAPPAIYTLLQPASALDRAASARNEGEYYALRAALSGLHSPESFAAGLMLARNKAEHALCKEEVAPYREGVERTFQLFWNVVQTYLKKDYPAPLDMEKIHFQVSVLKAAFFVEPEFVDAEVKLLRRTYANQNFKLRDGPYKQEKR